MTASTVLYVGGDRWDRVAGTDRRIALALAADAPVLWIDPPLPIVSRGPSEPRTPKLSDVAPGITRLRTSGPPLASKPIMRGLADRIMSSSVRRAVGDLNADVEAIVVASARGSFPSGVPGARVLYVTDDWFAGAGLMGLDSGTVRRRLERNLAEATLVCAVSPYLRDQLEERYGVHAELVPNGCDPVDNARLPGATRVEAALVGQLNERLEIGVLERVSESGVPILVIGPRTERDADTGHRLDAFLARPNVTWLGELPYTELPARLASVGVGLTPYADTEFNRSSFPLKTLEYIASGLPVVSTDLPAVRWLDTDLVSIAGSADDFADKVARTLSCKQSADDLRRRREFAIAHSWRARADSLRAVIRAGATG